MDSQQHVYVALSGGVDSTISAVRLLDDGYKVTGIYMQTWMDPKCRDVQKDSPTPGSMAAAAAKSLEIPFVYLDVRDHFFQEVVRSFIQQYLAGKTPNPCLFCNPQVKWGVLQMYALEDGADYFATGHYARIKAGPNEQVQLLKGVDKNKDQSYVLSMLSQTQLRRSLLPLGEMTKAEVRLQARALNLPTADRQDSQDLCFLGDIDYRDFLQRYAPEVLEPGEIISVDGQVLGEHQGLAFYTIGQRKGIRIAAPKPYYVVRKDTLKNRLIVGFSEQVKKNYLRATQPNWIASEPPAEGDRYDIMVHYRARPVPAKLISTTRDDFRLELTQPLRGITPGQVAVLYQADVCLGGGIIESVW